MHKENIYWLYWLVNSFFLFYQLPNNLFGDLVRPRYFVNKIIFRFSVNSKRIVFENPQSAQKLDSIWLNKIGLNRYES